jgi:hypothetical protein
MNRLQTALALLLLAFAPLARAINPVSLETDWNLNLFSISTVGVSALTADVGGFGAAGYAVVGNKYLANGTNGTTYGASLTVSTATPNVVGFSYSALVVGGTASMQVTQTLNTPAKAVGSASTTTGPYPNPTGTGTFGTFTTPNPVEWTFTAPVISTSSVIPLPSGVSFSGTFEAVVSNPIFYFTNLTAGATLYITSDFGTRKLK